MPSIKITTVVGARPQFVKAAAVSRAFAAANDAGGCEIDEQIVHTGQHYDRNMSEVFFDELQIPRPAENLEVGSGPHGRQTAMMLDRLEQVLEARRPDWLLIYGDTNSTLAGALAAAKMHIPIAHVEAGLRSFNRRMPEEINRVVADDLSALLLCPTATAVENLRAEGKCQGVHNVGDVMYDSVLFNVDLAAQAGDAVAARQLEPKGYYLATVHRAENTDDPARMNAILSSLGSADRPVVLPVHPRTRARLDAAATPLAENIRLIDPLSYLEMLQLERAARIILTDSGGVQKEAYWMAVPCITLRDETEWTELVATGCNRLASADADAIARALSDFEQREAQLPADRPTDLYGDGNAAGRIAECLIAAATG